MAATVAALLLAACGGAPGPPGGTKVSAEVQITQLIKAYGREPRLLCTSFATTAMIRGQFQTRASCLRLAGSPAAADPRVKVGRVLVKGDRAVAVRITETPPSAGTKSIIHLVKQQGRWRVSSVTPG